MATKVLFLYGPEGRPTGTEHRMSDEATLEALVEAVRGGMICA